MSLQVQATVAVKLESMNPLDSVEDRIGSEHDRRRGEKRQTCAGKSVLIKAHQWQHGHRAGICVAVQRLRVILVMPDTMSMAVEFSWCPGCRIGLDPGPKGIKAATKACGRNRAETPNAASSCSRLKESREPEDSSRNHRARNLERH